MGGKKMVGVISSFYGIEIMMDPTAFIESIQAKFKRATATFSLLSGEMIDYEKEFPEKEATFVKAWILHHQKELIENFRRAQKGATPNRVSQLDL